MRSKARFRPPWRLRVFHGAQNVFLELVRQCCFHRPGAWSQHPRTLLVYRTGRLGDFLNAMPALWSLRRQFPQGRIVLLTTSTTRPNMSRVTRQYAQENWLPWLDLMPAGLVDKVVVMPMAQLRQGARIVRALIASEEPDVMFLIPYSGESVTSKLRKLVFFRLAGVRLPIYGYRVSSTQGWFRQLQADLGMYRHQVLGALDGIWTHPAFPDREPTAADVEFNLVKPEAEEGWAEALWGRQNWRGKRVVALLLGASFPHKVWPLPKYLQVCKQLQRAGFGGFIVIGLASDRSAGEEMEACLGPDCLNLAGATSLLELAAVLRRCSLYLGNDSGPAHLAAAVGCPCVTLTASIEYPGMIEPFGNEVGSLRHPVPCAPCYSFEDCPLGTAECIRAIAPERVLQLCHQLAKPVRSAATAPVWR